MRAVKRELLFFALIGVLFFISTGFSAFNTEQNYRGENPDQVEPGRLTLDDRVGFAIILNAGYGTVQLVPAASDNGFTPHFLVADQFKPELSCISTKVGEATRAAPEGSGLQSLENPHALVEAILAAEQYNRGSLQRVLESAVARGTLYFTGHVPEMSLGLAQVKPSVARAVLPQAELDLMSEPELLDFLLDDCSSVYVASTYVASLLRAEPADRTLKGVIGDVAAQYNGGGNTAYVAAVISAFRLLANADLSASAAENTAAADPNALRLCAFFETGMPEGQVQVDGKDGPVPMDDATQQALASAQGVAVAMAQWEPGPKSYLARLSQMRLDWIAKALRDLGLPPGTLLMVQKAKPAGGRCGSADGEGGDSLRTSFGLVTVTLPPGSAVSP